MKETPNAPLQTHRKPTFCSDSNKEIKMCPICIGPMKSGSKLFTTDCNHTFHLNCIVHVPNFFCPCCRSYIRNADIDHCIKIIRSEVATHETCLRKLRKDYVLLKCNHMLHLQKLKRKVRLATLKMQNDLKEQEKTIAAYTNVLNATKTRLGYAFNDSTYKERKESRDIARDIIKQKKYLKLQMDEKIKMEVAVLL